MATLCRSPLKFFPVLTDTDCKPHRQQLHTARTVIGFKTSSIKIVDGRHPLTNADVRHSQADYEVRGSNDFSFVVPGRLRHILSTLDSEEMSRSFSRLPSQDKSLHQQKTTVEELDGKETPRGLRDFKTLHDDMVNLEEVCELQKSLLQSYKNEYRILEQDYKDLHFEGGKTQTKVKSYKRMGKVLVGAIRKKEQDIRELIGSIIKMRKHVQSFKASNKFIDDIFITEIDNSRGDSNSINGNRILFQVSELYRHDVNREMGVSGTKVVLSNSSPLSTVYKLEENHQRLCSGGKWKRPHDKSNYWHTRESRAKSKLPHLKTSMINPSEPVYQSGSNVQDDHETSLDDGVLSTCSITLTPRLSPVSYRNVSKQSSTRTHVLPEIIRKSEYDYFSPSMSPTKRTYGKSAVPESPPLVKVSSPPIYREQFFPQKRTTLCVSDAGNIKTPTTLSVDKADSLDCMSELSYFRKLKMDTCYSSLKPISNSDDISITTSNNDPPLCDLKPPDSLATCTTSTDDSVDQKLHKLTDQPIMNVTKSVNNNYPRECKKVSGFVTETNPESESSSEECQPIQYKLPISVSVTAPRRMLPPCLQKDVKISSSKVTTIKNNRQKADSTQDNTALAFSKKRRIYLPTLNSTNDHHYTNRSVFTRLHCKDMNTRVDLNYKKMCEKSIPKFVNPSNSVKSRNRESDHLHSANSMSAYDSDDDFVNEFTAAERAGILPLLRRSLKLDELLVENNHKKPNIADSPKIEELMEEIDNLLPSVPLHSIKRIA